MYSRSQKRHHTVRVVPNDPCWKHHVEPPCAKFGLPIFMMSRLAPYVTIWRVMRFITHWHPDMNVWVDFRLLTHVSGVWHTLYILSRNFAINHQPGKSTLGINLEHTIDFSTTFKNVSSTHVASNILSSKVVWHPFIRICSIFHCFTARRVSSTECWIYSSSDIYYRNWSRNMPLWTINSDLVHSVMSVPPS